MSKPRGSKELRILLVDDDELIRDAMEMYFGSTDILFHAVGTAEQALEKLRDQKFDVIITDYRLPGMDGLEFLKRLAASGNSARKAFTTAHGNAAVFARARELGAEWIIEKPLSVEKVEEFLGLKTPAPRNGGPT